MNKNKDWHWLILGVVLLLIAMGLRHANAMPSGAMTTPSIEFDCKGLRGVVLKGNGDLTINGKSFELRGGHNSTTILFENKVTMTGEREGDNLMLDNAVINYGGTKYYCRAI